MSAIRRVGVLGLGRMGLPMATHLLAAGFEVCGYDPDPSRAPALAAAGGRVSGSARDAAEHSQALIVIVADDGQVEAATIGPDGVLEGAAPGSVIVIASTVKPVTCRKVRDAAIQRGVGVLDAPVALGQRAAEEGRLTVYVGGERALFERCLPLFHAYGAEVVHIDEEVGAGQVAKLANNLVLWAGVVAVHEALSMAERLGVSPGRLRHALVHGSADGYALRELHLINLTWPHKDIEQALQVAADAGAELPLAAHVRGLIGTLTRDELRRICREGY
jgi:3-hydroxyisobutyrate dehydrogenase